MIPLTLHREPVPTIFHLLGRMENDLTYGLGWCLSQVPVFLDRVGEKLGVRGLSQDATIRLQEGQAGTGITDIEVHSPARAAWIIEAKSGFTVPGLTQLRQYADRLQQLPDPLAVKGLAVLAQSDRRETWLPSQLPREVAGIPIRAVSWRQVRQGAREARALIGHAGRRLLDEYIRYLDAVVPMKNETSNMVYVVSLSRSPFGDTTTVEMVEKHRRYSHPVGGGRGGWPTEPPNYLAFRYGGLLQSIHHVDDYEVITDFHPHYLGVPSVEIAPHFLYHLGPPMRPSKLTPTGANWRDTRVRCFIDTLLTCATIAEARAETARRTRTMGS